jgi:hypothetical protein
MPALRSPGEWRGTDRAGTRIDADDPGTTPDHLSSDSLADRTVGAYTGC